MRLKGMKTIGVIEIECSDEQMENRLLEEYLQSAMQLPPPIQVIKYYNPHIRTLAYQILCGLLSL